MRFSLRSTAFAILAIASVAANAQGVVRFYFSDAGGDNARISQDIVTGPSWEKEYDICIANTGNADIVFNAANVLLGYSLYNGQSAATFVAGSDSVSVHNAADLAAANANSNITARAPWFVGNFAPSIRGGQGVTNSSTEQRPGGMSIGVDLALNQTHTLVAGTSEMMMRVKLRNNGFYGNGQPFKDVFLFTGPRVPSSSSGSTCLINGGVNIVPPDWQNDSRLRLLPEPGTMLALVAGLGALAARRRRK